MSEEFIFVKPMQNSLASITHEINNAYVALRCLETRYDELLAGKNNYSMMPYFTSFLSILDSLPSDTAGQSLIHLLRECTCKVHNEKLKSTPPTPESGELEDPVGVCMKVMLLMACELFERIKWHMDYSSPKLRKKFEEIIHSARSSFLAETSTPVSTSISTFLESILQEGEEVES